MPSLTTNNSRRSGRISTYDYVIPKKISHNISGRFVSPESSILSHGDTSSSVGNSSTNQIDSQNHCSHMLFFIINLSVIFIGFSICVAPKAGLEHWHDYAHHSYEQRKLYIVSDWYPVIFNWLFVNFMIFYFLFPIKAARSNCSLKFFIFSFVTLLYGLVCYSIYWWLTEPSWKIYYYRFWHASCHVLFYCDYFTARNLYFVVFCKYAMPFVIFLLLLFMDCIFGFDKCFTLSNQHEYPIDKTSNINMRYENIIDTSNKLDDFLVSSYMHTGATGTRSNHNNANAAMVSTTVSESVEVPMIPVPNTRFSINDDCGDDDKKNDGGINNNNNNDNNDDDDKYDEKIRYTYEQYECQINSKQNMRKLLVYFVVFWFFYLLYTFCVFLMSNNQMSIYEKYWKYWFVLWLVIYVIFKQILKRIAAYVDVFQIKTKIAYGKNINSASDIIMSFEWITELIVGATYFIGYRYLVTYILPFESVYWFIILTLSHSATESIQSILFRSEFGYKWFNYFTRKIRINSDDSYYHQWLVRHSIDIMVRIYTSIITGFFQIGWIYAEDDDVFYFDNRQQAFKASCYILISVLMDVAVFIISYIISIKYFNFNLIYPFRMIYNQHKYYLIVCFVLCFAAINLE